MREKTENMMKALQSKIEELGAHDNTLTAGVMESSAKIKELEKARNELDKDLKESNQSLSVKAKKLSEVQSQHSTEKKRLEDELCVFKKENDMLQEKLRDCEEGKASLCRKNEILESDNLILKNIASTKQEEKGKCEANVSALTMDAEKRFAKIQELENGIKELNFLLKDKQKSMDGMKDFCLRQLFRLQDDLDWNRSFLRIN
eukprot:CAMPEP_0175082950 /NCGR_PEP_ID=MMETSP0052_2-20121109/27055_1 /TAXON_ID=51329 ORGANISM="Polytomella parva, Strain SAG 63-3" /NCGR_SAMPLE_ID=MMETSP0052_2 /ASSEMBLY_ACC=CAM_ASM_000194 /LENGTH=202 /DNA_ID=CAMNT_0016354233 /DNA_START=347 /DNA_END=958 /DNA_ORIENTATION=-